MILPSIVGDPGRYRAAGDHYHRCRMKPPTVALTNTDHDLRPEDYGYDQSATKVADIVVTDDALGTNDP